MSSNTQKILLSSVEELVRYLEENQSIYLEKWRESIIIDFQDIHRNAVRENGAYMYELVKKSVMGTISENEIKLLAYKVAKERVEANINIGNFVYNVNLGRSIVINCILNTGISNDLLLSIIDRINSQFDLFCYHAVTRYTDLKNQELQEKNVFISQTHKERLALLGQVSSSFVHEFRNPLTAVMGFVKLLIDENPTLNYLDIIDAELKQLNFRVTQFLHTSKVNVIEKDKEDVEVSNLVNEILNFLYPSITDGNVSIHTDIHPNIKMEINKDQIKQVILNILVNSIDAIKLKESTREVTISCQEIEEEVIINISNNGPVIPSEILQYIFEPFFTTKELGTGIGLFVCKNIIEKHKGKITCTSNEELTTFRISLPMKT